MSLYINVGGDMPGDGAVGDITDWAVGSVLCALDSDLLALTGTLRNLKVFCAVDCICGLGGEAVATGKETTVVKDVGENGMNDSFSVWFSSICWLPV
jgi:hypothetical protein